MLPCMATLYSAADVARQLGCDKSTITRHCKANGIGQMVGGRLLLTGADLKRLTKLVQNKRGNPNFTAGNYFGGARERPEFPESEQSDRPERKS